MKYLFICLLCSVKIVAFSQKSKFNYYLNQDLVSVKKADAILLGKGMHENGLFRLDCFNKQNNSLSLTAHFADSTLSSLEGSYESFFPDHQKKSSGNYKNNLQDGVWQNWDSLGLLKDSVYYVAGKKTIKANYTYDKARQVISYEYTDSLADIYSYHYYIKGSIFSTAEFKGNSGIYTLYDSTGKTKSSEVVTSRKMEEAQFPGGPKAFKQYLEKNLNGIVATDNNAPAGSYTVIIRFIVDKDGSISDVTPETHMGYGMENECMRIIANSPNWLPAMQFGRAVKAYRRQPFSFVVSK